jgi:hypothetical protein
LDNFTYVIITETVLTATLASVLYGIINIGDEGSFPNHDHSSSEGQGGQLDFSNLTNVQVAFTDLTDTPLVILVLIIYFYNQLVLVLLGFLQKNI